ncbi:MAG: DNA-3-methyladenine glycosylase I [Thermodesulfobacteriota bacterium]
MPQSAPKNRCAWVTDHPLYVAYHDREWGVPIFDDLRLFEFLVLETAQAGLSWLTILKKREGYRRAFDGFDPAKVALYGEEKIRELLADSGIVRNRKKIESAVKNARAFLAVQEKEGAFSDFAWSFVEGKPLVNAYASIRDIPAQTPLSQRLSREMSRRGFCFVGPVVMQSFLEAVGLVNNHTADCFRFHELRTA